VKCFHCDKELNGIKVVLRNLFLCLPCYDTLQMLIETTISSFLDRPTVGLDMDLYNARSKKKEKE
jgi:hypothetical protein